MSADRSLPETISIEAQWSGLSQESHLDSATHLSLPPNFLKGHSTTCHSFPPSRSLSEPLAGPFFPSGNAGSEEVETRL